LAIHRFSFWYWKLGGTVKNTTLYITIAIILCNHQNLYDAPALNLEKKWALMIVTSKLHAFFEYIQQ